MKPDPRGGRAASRGVRSAGQPRHAGPGAPERTPDLFELTDGAPPPRPAPARARPAPAVLPGTGPSLPFNVEELNTLTKALLEGALTDVWVRGEVTDFKPHRNGHWYFCLRDSAAQIRCVVWGSDVYRMLAAPDDGMQVIVQGRLTMYAARGELQLRVLRLQGIGDGLWRKAFERTRARLEAEGLLSSERKRCLPLFPRRVAVVTSADGAALHDIAAVVRRRCPAAELVVVPAAVQGDGAPDSLCAALDRVARWGKAQVLIVGRGGGAREDLWAFNDERVARALAASRIPTISAVGHEVDVTICDLVADVRAATPSAAAESAVPVLRDLVEHVRDLGVAMQGAANQLVEDSRARLQDAARHAAAQSQRIVERGKLRLDALGGRLNALSPLATLGRGYAVATDADGRVRGRVSGLTAGDALNVRFIDGVAETSVVRVSRRAEEDTRR